jgi:hypothetical protein
MGRSRGDAGCALIFLRILMAKGETPALSDRRCLVFWQIP